MNNPNIKKSEPDFIAQTDLKYMDRKYSRRNKVKIIAGCAVVIFVLSWIFYKTLMPDMKHVHQTICKSKDTA